MKPIKQLFRLVQINYILAKNGLDNWVVSLRLFSPLRFIVYLNPWNWARKEKLTPAIALRKTLEELGPIFIKFGQALSTRPDILPPDIAAELSLLQDKVPPFASEKALAIIEKTFGSSAYEIFAEFDSMALASASMAQVHAATLKTGQEVVVKILRPNMRKTIEQDLSIMHTLANWAEKYWPEAKRFKPREIVEEFEHNLLNEMDLQREAANAAQLRRNFQNSPLLYIPEVHWNYVTDNIMVMERIYGIPVSDVKTMRELGINLKLLAERGVEIFFTQVFRDCFFHADMHPGNIFVNPEHPHNPQYICIDFGIVGTLSQNDKRYLAENLIAFFNRDYHRVAELHVESGWVARDTRIEDFEAAIRTVCEPIFEKPLIEISFAQVVLRLFQVARRFHMEVQPQLVLLQKTLLAIEGLGRQLYPELDLWATAKPYLESWIREQMGPRQIFKNLKMNLPYLAEQLPEMPRLILELLNMQKENQLRQWDETKMAQSSPINKGNQYKSLATGAFLAFFVSGCLTYSQSFTAEQFVSLSLTAAALSAIIAFLNRNNRS